jgi:MSHA pilin protein MshD
MRGGFIKNKGFTLIEIVIFIVVFSLGVMGIMVLFYNTLGKTSDPLLRVQAVQTAQAVMEIVAAKKFDETTPNGGGKAERFSEFKNDNGENNVEQYDDIDDYVDSCNSEKAYTSTDLGLKGNYDIKIKITYAHIDGSNTVSEDCTQSNYKMITVTVGKNVLNETYTLKKLKGNF